jgi:TPR repeat protein
MIKIINKVDQIQTSLKNSKFKKKNMSLMVKKLAIFIFGLTLYHSISIAAPPCAKRLPDDLEKFAGLFNRLDAVSDQASLYGYYKCLSRRDDIEGQFRRGVAYEKGYGVDQNLLKAASWYRKAAFAKYSTIRVVRGIDEPFYRKSDPDGHPEAQYRLGLMYLEGRGKRQHDGFALSMFNMARKQGHTEAAKKATEVRKRINAAKLKQKKND